MFAIKEADVKKRIWPILIVILLFGCTSTSDHWRPLKDSDLFVQKSAIPLPHDAKVREAHLFKEYTGKLLDADFGMYVLAKLELRPHYEAVLKAKAREIGADEKSLAAILETIFQKGSNEEERYIPFAAYETSLDGNPVWIVMLSWVDFGYIAAYAYDQKTLKQVGMTVYM